jgi:hypothetical protein
MSETNILIIPISIIVAAFLIRWYASFVDTLQESRDRRLRALQIAWLDRCYSVSMAERLNQAWYKQTMDDKYYD